MPEQDDPFEELFEDEELGELFAEFVDLLASVPLWVWLALALAVYWWLSSWLSTPPEEPTGAPEREPREGPPRERYSIHDDIEDVRTYEEPSESDPIETPSKVDRSIWGTMKRIARLGRSREGD